PFHIDAVVIMPDHLHAMWTLPVGDADYPMRWSLIKAGFSRYIPNDECRNPSRIAKGERGIWQRSFWEHMVRDQNDFNIHMNYIRFNPVKHGLVTRVKDWPHSTLHRCVREGLYPPDWCGDGMDDANDADSGE
ncbi:MAG: transposase, partial [Candidatus Brocadiaceae bacterium]|nr:transposase [Candidatus Brocadiaceae bacterium]